MEMIFGITVNNKGEALDKGIEFQAQLHTDGLFFLLSCGMALTLQRFYPLFIIMIAVSIQKLGM